MAIVSVYKFVPDLHKVLKEFNPNVNFTDFGQ